MFVCAREKEMVSEKERESEGIKSQNICLFFLNLFAYPTAQGKKCDGKKDY